MTKKLFAVLLHCGDGSRAYITTSQATYFTEAPTPAWQASCYEAKSAREVECLSAKWHLPNSILNVI